MRLLVLLLLMDIEPLPDRNSRGQSSAALGQALECQRFQSSQANLASATLINLVTDELLQRSRTGTGAMCCVAFWVGLGRG
jgi:hypothetical protein